MMMPNRNGRRLFLVLNNFEFFLSHRLQFAQAAQASGYEVTIVTPPHKKSNELHSLGFSFRPFPLSRRGLNPLAELWSIFRLALLYRSERPDIVHHFTIKPMIYGSLAAALTSQKRTVNTVTGLGFIFVAERGWAIWVRPLVFLLYRLAFLRRSVQVIFQNPDDRDLFLQNGLIKNSQAHVILGSGVDPNQFPALPSPAGIPVVLFPGRMLWDKGVGELIEAGKKMAALGLNFEIWLAGPLDSGNPAAIEEATLREWEKSPWLKWLGKRDDMAALYARSQIVCLPSYREGVPRALIEAASCGRAIVTTDVPGCREMVVEGLNGFLVPARDADRLAERLGQLIVDHNLREKFASEGRRRVLEKFTLERVNAATLAIYGVTT